MASGGGRRAATMALPALVMLLLSTSLATRANVAEDAKQEVMPRASEAAQDAKEMGGSWADWVRNQISRGFGFGDDHAGQASHQMKDEARHMAYTVKDQVSSAASASRASETMGNAMATELTLDAAEEALTKAMETPGETYKTASDILTKMGNATGTGSAMDAMGEANEQAKATSGNAYGTASDILTRTAETSNRKMGYAKDVGTGSASDATEEAKATASTMPGDAYDTASDIMTRMAGPSNRKMGYAKDAGTQAGDTQETAGADTLTNAMANHENYKGFGTGSIGDATGNAYEKAEAETGDAYETAEDTLMEANTNYENAKGSGRGSTGDDMEEAYEKAKAETSDVSFKNVTESLTEPAMADFENMGNTTVAGSGRAGNAGGETYKKAKAPTPGPAPSPTPAPAPARKWTQAPGLAPERTPAPTPGPSPPPTPAPAPAREWTWAPAPAPERTPAPEPAPARPA